MPRAIVLIGPMGAGKTTLGKRLAKRLELPFTDTDKLVIASHGQIAKIFSDFGEDYFRKLESAALKQALEVGGVIATGGGVVVTDSNRKLIANRHVIFLDTTMDHVLKSLNTEKRPLLRDNPSNWQAIYDSRLPYYRECSKFQVRTDSRPVTQILDELEEKANAEI